MSQTEVLISNLQEKSELKPEAYRTIEALAQAAVESEGSLGATEVSITFVDDPYMQTLNRQYRGIDAPTDVLSFAQLEKDETEPPVLTQTAASLGDVVISLERATIQAAEYGHSLEREIGFLVVHGLLHLLGYDHTDPATEAAMTAKADTILARCGLGR